MQDVARPRPPCASPPVGVGQDDIEAAGDSAWTRPHDADLLARLCEEVREIHCRNREKEADKAFEGSYTRMVFIMALTYATLFAYLLAIDVPRPALNAVVPSIGFNLSTWSLPTVKRLWLRATGRDKPPDT